MKKRTPPKRLVALRINPEAMLLARIAAVSSEKTLGLWLEEAIREKIEREKGKGRHGHDR